MASYDNTGLANITIEILWDHKTLKGRYASGVIFPRVLNRSEVVTKGQRVSIPIEPVYTDGAVAAGGGFTPSNTAPTQANIDIDTWRYVSIEIDDQASTQSFWDPLSSFPTAAGKASAIRFDTTLANFSDNLLAANAVGDATNGDPFDDGMARAAMLKLADLNIPMEDLSFFVPPKAVWTDMLSKVELTAAHYTGNGKSLLTAGFSGIAKVVGVPIYQSTVIQTVGARRQGMLLHKEALGIAFQMKNKYRVADRAGSLVLGKVGVMEFLFGAAVIRSNHGCALNISA